MIEQIREYDIDLIFFQSVTLQKYLKKIKFPIHFGQILDRIKAKQYNTVSDVQSDIDLLFANCYQYNGVPDIQSEGVSLYSVFGSHLQWILNQHIDAYKASLVSAGWINADNIISNAHPKSIAFNIPFNSISNAMQAFDAFDNVKMTPIISEQIKLIIER